MAAPEIHSLTDESRSPEQRPSLAQALVVVLGVVVFLAVGSGVLGLAPHGPLLWSIVLTGLVGRYWMELSWEDLYGGVEKGLVMGLQAILILFVIYALIATWVSAGTIPGMMYYGLSILTPTIFLPATALLSTVVAIAIGSSWTTAGTLGVAFIGIGAGLGIPAPMTAGAVLTGAYAGDKQSPLSDTTNLAAGVTDTDLYDHIRAMRLGTLLALGISVVLFAVLGLQTTGAIPAGQINEIRSALAGTYAISPLVFVPLLVTFGLALYGYPALSSLLAGVFAGVGATIALQGASFTAAWEVFLNGTAPKTGVETVNSLLASGGLSGSAWTIGVVVAALSLGGLLETLGILAVLARALEKTIHGVSSLVAATGLSAIVVNLFSAQQYMSIAIPGLSLRSLYEEYDLDSSTLSQAVEAAGTPTGALIPWHAGGIYMASVLGVATLQYAPYYFFGYLSPLILFAMAATGRGLETVDTDEPIDSAATADD
ncbi:MAG TPA: Na+/H+ antiporter NhaC family protein [Halococcus sp.]|nr:Na+/H+ antiporter NhaC family protein [Halococcus sp.]